MFVCNFTPVEWEDYRVGVPHKKTLKLILDSDDVKFGGNSEKVAKSIKVEKKSCDGQEYYAAFSMKPFTSMVFVF